MKVEREYTIVGVKGKSGEMWFDVFPPFTEMINVRLRDGEFVGLIWDLAGWCMRHGFQCTITKQTISVEFPEMTTE